MTYVLLLLCAGTCAYLLSETMVAMREGRIVSRRATFRREDHPFHFWSSVGAWMLIAAVSAIVFVLLAASIAIPDPVLPQVAAAPPTREQFEIG